MPTKPQPEIMKKCRHGQRQEDCLECVLESIIRVNLSVRRDSEIPAFLSEMYE